MTFRSSGSLMLVALVLVGMSIARPLDGNGSFDPVSHGAGACDSDGVTTGYVVSFSDAAPKGFKVTEVSVTGLAQECRGDEISVGLWTTDGAQLATSVPVPVDATSMTLAVAPSPLAEQVGGISVAIEGEELPTLASPPVAMPDAPSPDEEHRSDLPDSVCLKSTHICGTTQDDVMTITRGSLITGPGRDVITVETDPSAEVVEVDAGSGADTVALSVSADPGTVQKISIRSGTGADAIRLSFESVPTGALVEITIVTGSGADQVGLPAFLPEGVTVTVNTGAHDDTVSTRGTDLGVRSDVAAATSTPGGYRIIGGRGDDSIEGGLGPDAITGRRGADVIKGGAGSDVLAGHGGSDRLVAGTGWDIMIGGRGYDTCVGTRDPGAARRCEVDTR